MFESRQADKRSALSAAAIGGALLLCCLCLLIVSLGGYLLYDAGRPAPAAQTPIVQVAATLPGIPPEATQPAPERHSNETLEALQNTIVPANEPNELACRLDGKCDIPPVMAVSAAARVVGDADHFWVTDVGTNENKRVPATLRYVTEHAYFWVQDGVPYADTDMSALMDTFETGIYPTDREFFGAEWTPGIDGDGHIYILYARGLGSSIAGYFSSSDSVHPLINEFSNAHEMFLFNADNTFLGEEFTYGVLAHEFQHMIHWNQDRNETSWLNEGASELAAFLNGYDPGGFDWSYISEPDLQLNDWPNDPDRTTPHYGAGFLFMTYFLDRFGEEATQRLVQDPANGLDSLDHVLREINALDPATGQPVGGDDFFMDWAVSNFVLDASIGDGRYTYRNYPAADRAAAGETISTCPQSLLTRDVHQYGVDYIAIACEGDHTLHFTGAALTGLLPVDPYSGRYAFWSNKGDASDMKLTREFDLTNISAPIEMSYRTWYDIETDWDYLYLEVSEDGQIWRIIPTPSGTGTDPSGNSYGWGYSGQSQGWIEEQVDLSAYAGRNISIRFEYVTDAAVNGEGLLLDDVSLDAAGYSSDFETDQGGWTAEGFVRVQNVLPQTFGLALIQAGDQGVRMIPLNPDQSAQIPISLGSNQLAYLVVSGTTRFTRELGSYQVEIR